jgi:hypothetical protein
MARLRSFAQFVAAASVSSPRSTFRAAAMAGKQRGRQRGVVGLAARRLGLGFQGARRQLIKTGEAPVRRPSGGGGGDQRWR